MSLPLPTSLSPSKVTTFKDCALAFRFSAIDRLPEAPSPWTFKGTLVHRALERFFWSTAPAERRLDRALLELAAAWEEAEREPELGELGLSGDAHEALRLDTEALVRRYFELEDPGLVTPVGLELTLEARVGRMLLRGIIDRLDVDEEGELVVTDYKTGRVPSESREQGRMGGVHFYAFLCEQVFGRPPARVQLLYLSEPLAIVATPSKQSLRGLQRRAEAIWSAVERACRDEDFRPHPSGLCPHCSYRSYCPAFGGDPSLAASSSPIVKSAKVTMPRPANRSGPPASRSMTQITLATSAPSCRSSVQEAIT